MYRSEDGKPMFHYKFALFASRSKEKQVAEANKWLEEWTGDNSYCTNGWQIVKDSYEPWPHALLDPVPIGGTAVEVGLCNPSASSSVTSPSIPTATLVVAASSTPESGEYRVNAERLARAFNCGAEPKFVVRSDDFETYSLACWNRKPIVLRCAATSCREVQ
jgi:hypothetical protein